MKPAAPERTPLFRKESSGSVYRIPALIYITEENLFLAFAEKRKSETDADAENLVMRRGIYKTGYVSWEGVQSLHDLCLKDHRMMNPCPVYEDTTKTLFLFFNSIRCGATESSMKKWGNRSKLCYSTSKDFGKTWSAPTDITDVTSGIGNLATLFLSPGHGIQTQCGKLVVPAYVYVAKFWCACWCCVKAHAFYIYSEDQGTRWRISERIEKHECGECQLAEIITEDGQRMLYCNARSTSNRRVEALMLNVGGEFKLAEKSRSLKESEGGCSGSVLSFSGLEQPGQGRHHWLIFSHPTKKERKDLGIYLNRSPLNSEAWSKPWVIHDGPSAYSDLAHCKDTNTFAVLFESGAGTPYEEINFCLFTLEDILENVNKKKSIFSRFRK